MKLKVGGGQKAIPEGQYLATVKTIKSTTVINKRPALQFTFEVAEGPHAGAQLQGFVNANYKSFSPNTKLWSWYFAATGDALEEGGEIDTDDFFGKVFLVVVETKPSRKTGIPFSNVTQIIQKVLDL